MDATHRPGSRTRARTLAIEGGRTVVRHDWLATEEPLEIRLAAGGQRRSVAVTMRTPGADFELAVGYLHGEGIIGSGADIAAVRYCVDRGIGQEQQFNIVTVDLTAPSLPDLATLERYGTMTSACGVCGKATLEALDHSGVAAVTSDISFDAEVLWTLPERLREAQAVFESTGGLHAAAAFDRDGELLAIREDVGRHNALDKLIGSFVLAGGDGAAPGLSEAIVLVSGRASFELVQKAASAGVPCLAAVSAPSSLAVDVAREFGVTLVGFLRGERANVYTHPERIHVGATDRPLGAATG